MGNGFEVNLLRHNPPNTKIKGEMTVTPSMWKASNKGVGVK